MTLKRETIAIVGAIVGVNLIGIMTYSQAANSSGLCDDFTQMWQGTANRQAAPATGEPIGTYHDVRAKRDLPYYRDGEAPQVPHIRQNGAWVQPSANADINENPVAVAPQLPPAVAPTAYSPQPLSRAENRAPIVDDLDRGNLERARERARGTLKPDSQGNVGL